MIVLPVSERRADVLDFIRRHHYTRRAPGVWTVAYGLENRRGKLCAVAVYGPPPYPSIARAFVRCPEHAPKMIWQARMVGAGISAADLDGLLNDANADLLQRGYWWVHTLTDHVEKVIDGTNLFQRGYTGNVYHRNGWLFLGQSGSHKLEGFLIDGTPVHIRQGANTLTLTNVRGHYPEAKDIRPLHGNAKQRWAYVLASTERERAERALLMAYHVQPYEPMTQPRLLTKGMKLCLNL